MDRGDIVCQSDCTDFPKIDWVDINGTDASWWSDGGGGGTRIPLEMPVPISINVADT